VVQEEVLPEVEALAGVGSVEVLAGSPAAGGPVADGNILGKIFIL